MEFLEIVTPSGMVVGRAERKEVHRKHLLHRAVEVLLANDKGQVLLQLRKSSKAEYPLYWTASVSGHVDPGESPEDCAKREMHEEIGAKAKLDLLGSFIVDDEYDHELTSIFFGKSNGPFKFDEGEIEQAGFFDFRQVFEKRSGMKMTPHCRKALELVAEKRLL